MIFFLLFAAAAAAKPMDDDTRFRACLALVKDDTAKAVAEGEAWTKQDDGAPARTCLGLAYAAAERWLPAATAFTRAATFAETARDNRAAALWTQAGNAAIAADEPALGRTALDRALKLPGLTQTMQGEAWLDRARADVALDDAAEARRDLDIGLKLVPEDPFAWLLSATLARRENDLARASRDISSAAKLAPDDAGVALEAGNIAMAAGAEPAAKVAWEKAKSLAPGDPAGQAAAARLADLVAGSNRAPAPGAPPSK